MKKYLISWDERRCVRVEAENEKEARDKLTTGEYDQEARESAEMNGSFEITELSE